ncbi:MAG: Na/Pi cotransporter family protein [Lentisphaeria bacterium]|nr:Na/Pi cotransporter family protein [Lentisphaeria bacterium]
MGHILIKTLEIVGSVAVFVYGMRVLSEGLQKIAGSRLQAVLNGMTRNRCFAVLTGFLVTGVIQSSSATTIMVVTFVNAGLLTLVQAIGVIMGANIGTTVTGWIVSVVGFHFHIAGISFPLLAVAFPLMLCREQGRKDIAQVLIGFGLLLMGLQFLKDAVPDIRGNPEMLDFLAGRSGMFWLLHYILFVSVGAGLTILMQSSSATMAVTITLAYRGAIDFPSAAAMVLGENIGTTIKANLVAIGARPNARRAARVHTVFNLAGVLWMTVLFCPWFRPVLFEFLDAIVPGPLAVPGASVAAGPYLPENLPMHISMFHTLFNTVNTLVFIGFVPHLAAFVSRLIPAGPEEEAQGYRLQFFDSTGPDTARANLLTASKEMVSMAAIARDMLGRLVDRVTNGTDPKEGPIAKALQAREELTDTMQEQITHVLAQCAERRLDEGAADEVAVMIRIVNVLEEFADHCYKLALLLDRAYARKRPFEAEAAAHIGEYAREIQAFACRYLERVGRDLSPEDQREAKRLCAGTDALEARFVKAARRRIQSGGNIKGELLVVDILRHFEQIASCTLELCRDMATPA